jgi:hypothetical protein
MNRDEKHGRFTALLYVVTSAVLLVVSSVCIHLSRGTSPNAPIVHWLGAALILAGVAWILAMAYLVSGR